MARRVKFWATGSRPDVERGNEAGQREREKMSIVIESKKGEFHVGNWGGGGGGGG